MFLKMCPAHRDKAEIKCMGPVGGKHQQNQKYIYSSLSLSIGSKTKLMGVDTIFGHVSLDAYLELMRCRSADKKVVTSSQKSCR